ncbi:membrane protein insertase YidC [Candidatus Poribacteria bacterium]|nr:membrane protein insertase YidC [Candidatus Poribacteria bacterium]
MEKRMLLAIVASVAIMVIWTFLFPTAPVPNENDKKSTATINQTARINEKLQEKNIAADSILTEKDYTRGKEINDVNLENELIKLVFTNRGAVLKQIILKKHKDNDLNDIKLLQISKDDINLPLGIFFEKSTLNNELNLGIWDFETKKYGNKSALIFTYLLLNETENTDNTPKLKIQKEFILDENNYIVSSKIKFINLNSANETVSQHKLSWEPLLKDTETGKKEEGFVSCIAGKIDHKKASGIEEKKIFDLNETGSIENSNWISMTNKYFVIAMMPGINSKSLWIDKKGEKDNAQYSIGINMGEKILEPGTSIEESFDIYMGPKEYDRLKSLGKNLEENIDFGFFGLMSKGLLIVFHYLYKLVNNYGLAIIIITLIIKILFMPLTEKSFVSMKKMHTIQPMVDSLKQKYKNDPQRLNAEIMNLYKEKNVNPFSGCLPMLIQLPIFWALFNAFNTAIELRHAPFMWWIKDLSRPDTIAQVGPISINILPIFMLISMVIQQRMTTHRNPNATKEEQMQQKFLLIGMPIIFGVMFYGMPSGLVLYWFLSNVLGIIHQYYINRKLSLQN